MHEFVDLYRVDDFDDKKQIYEVTPIIPAPKVTKANHPLFYTDHDVWRIGCSREFEEIGLEIAAKDLNMTTFFRDKDFELKDTDVGVRFCVKRSSALALERYYIERRMDAAEMFRLGSFKKPIPEKIPKGFRNNVKESEL